MEHLHLTKKTRSVIHELTGLALKHLPMTFSNSDIAPGRKVFFPIPLKMNPKNMTDYLYVYVESKLPDTPHDEELGFTQDDIIDEAGVYLFRKKQTCVDGETLSLDVLFNVIDDDLLRIRLIERIKEMRDMIHLNDDFLDCVTSLWNSKEIIPISKRLH